MVWVRPPPSNIPITTNPYQGLKYIGDIGATGATGFQLLQIPIRDWNFVKAYDEISKWPFQLLQIPIRDWNLVAYLPLTPGWRIPITTNPYQGLKWNLAKAPPDEGGDSNYYKSLSGIEIFLWRDPDPFPRQNPFQLLQIPIRDWNFSLTWLPFIQNTIPITTNPYQGLKCCNVANSARKAWSFQLLQIPIRDWNRKSIPPTMISGGFQLLQIPIRDWNVVEKF